MARPEKSAQDKRAAQLKVRLTDAEIAQLRAAATTAGLSVSDYARLRMLSGGVPVRMSVRRDPALVSELNRIGVNINQLARAHNRGRRFVGYWHEVGAELRTTLHALLEPANDPEDHSQG